MAPETRPSLGRYPLAVRIKRIGLLAAGVLGWAWFALLGSALIAYGAGAVEVPDYWMLDWHVYYAGAWDFLDRELYQHALGLPGFDLPTPVFNLPPAAAAVAIPFAALGREAGGVAWLFAGLASIGASALIAAALTAKHQGWAWAGLGLLLYAAYPDFVSHVLYGNNNHLLLAILAGFAWAHINRRPLLAGTLLGVAIAVKLWPVALFPLLMRERQWSALAVTSATVFALTAAMLVWLGADALEPMLAALRFAVPTDDQSPYVWTTWARENWDWWPVWLAPVAGGALTLLPLRGRAGLGLGLFGGVMLVNNIWSHYIPTMMLGLLLLGSGIYSKLVATRRARAETATLDLDGLVRHNAS